jgi:hypothetical protein
VDPFVERLQQWQIFYATVAAACATLTGLLFVALSMNVDLLNRAENTERMLLARQTFSEFLLVLMVALVFLIPGLGPLGLSVALVALGGAWIFSAGRSFRAILRKGKTASWFADYLRGFGLSIMGAIGVLLVAVCMLLGYFDSLYGLVFMLAALLGSASRNAWALLVEVRGDGAAKRREEAAKRGEYQEG